MNGSSKPSARNGPNPEASEQAPPGATPILLSFWVAYSTYVRKVKRKNPNFFYT